MPTTPNPEAQPAPIRFSLGQVVATPAVLTHLTAHGISAREHLQRHQHGDWGDLCQDDIDSNQEAIVHGERVFSSYQFGQDKIWIITEWDRSVTTILLPIDY